MSARSRCNAWTPHLLICLVIQLVVLTLAGCTTTYPMMPTPMLYAGPQAKLLFTDVPPERRTPQLELLFITDRAPAASAEGELPYTSDRSRSVAFGSATIEFGEGVSWDTLVEQSTLAQRTVALDLSLGQTKELGRFPPIPYEIAVTSNGISRSPAVLDAHDKTTQALQAEVARRLASAPRKEAVLYVHGYNNSFRDAALTMGQLCHFLGREFVCAIFTWPAGGRRGILFGYNVDYESSAFAVEDLVKAFRIVAATPGLERIHVLAHSRGTDVIAGALSTLAVESYILESTLAQRYKVGNVVLIAPDIDADIAPTRIFRTLSDPDLPYGTAPKPRIAIPLQPDFKITLYVSPDDKALATASWLFGSMIRLGRVDPAMLSPAQIEQVRRLGLADVIQVRGTTDYFGHGYFVSNPRVSADIIAMLRYRLKPNEPGRPLEEVQRPFWRVQTEGGAGTR